MKTIYTASAHIAGGREGQGRTDDGRLEVKLSLPKELGGPGGEGTNPEQLFAVGFGACYESALRYVGRQRKQKVDLASIDIRVSLLSDESGGFQLAVEMRCKIPGLSLAETQELMDAASQVCPYSKATRGNVETKYIAEAG